MKSLHRDSFSLLCLVTLLGLLVAAGCTTPSSTPYQEEKPTPIGALPPAGVFRTQ